MFWYSPFWSLFLDESIDEFLVSDELRKSLALGADSNAFSDEQRNEFIHHVFSHLALGGWICQYEDTLAEYLEATRIRINNLNLIIVYKDFISVRKSSEGKVEVSSRVFKVVGFTSTSPLFSNEHKQNFCYVSVNGIDGGPRVVDVWYHALT